MSQVVSIIKRSMTICTTSASAPINHKGRRLVSKKAI